MSSSVKVTFCDEVALCRMSRIVFCACLELCIHASYCMLHHLLLVFIVYLFLLGSYWVRERVEESGEFVYVTPWFPPCFFPLWDLTPVFFSVLSDFFSSWVCEDGHLAFPSYPTRNSVQFNLATQDLSPDLAIKTLPSELPEGKP